MSAFDFISPKDKDWKSAVDQFRWYRVDRFILHATRWADYITSGPKLTWNRIRFTKDEVKKLKDDKMGLYSFVAEPQIAGHSAIRYLLYVGKADGESIKKRVTSYFYQSQIAKPRIHVSEMLEKFTSHLYLYYAVVDNVTTITQVENKLLETFLPPFNRNFPATVRNLVKATFS